VSRKQWLLIGGSAAVALFLVIVFTAPGTTWKKKAGAASTSNGWNREAIQATYVASQFREVDKAHSSLILSYDLKNETDLDYHLTDGPGVVIMRRLRSNGSLSEEEPVRLTYPVFLPARQRARMAIEISRSFSWPAREDRQYEDKLRDFVKQRLAGVGEFVLFDVATHCQIELPGAWQDLEDSRPPESN